MANARYADFKLAKQTGATSHFARVTIAVEDSEVDEVTVSASDESIRGWRESVMAGGREAVLELRGRGCIEGPLRVDVTAFLGLPTDTSDDDARKATFMAVIVAFPEMDRPSLDLRADEDRWEIVWPD